MSSQITLGSNCGSCEVREHCLGARVVDNGELRVNPLGYVAYVQAGLDSCSGGALGIRKELVYLDNSVVLAQEREVITHISPEFPVVSWLERAYYALREQVTNGVKPIPPTVQQSIAAHALLNLNAHK